MKRKEITAKDGTKYIFIINGAVHSSRSKKGIRRATRKLISTLGNTSH